MSETHAWLVVVMSGFARTKSVLASVIVHHSGGAEPTCRLHRRTSDGFGI